MSKKKAILYARFSPRPNAADCLSIETQFDRLRAWCLALGYEVVGEYSDESKSGRSTDNRPQLELAIAHACKAKCIVCVYSLSRLARNTKDALSIAERLKKNKADLTSLHERIETATSMGRFFFTITASLGQLERELTAERTQDAMLHHQQNGRRMGRRDRCPFGWRIVQTEGIDDGKMKVDEDEQAIIEEIIYLRSAGATYRGVCQELDRRGVKRRGKTWHNAHGLVRTILNKAGVS